ncbi:heme/hemin ABC transporter substrate-binding protein [Parasedimentitalea huanghaiensis]|uniref:ABC transporter substrate-binding protein n=1 Tax=Parasedimentitalea huanghaiensis TaxID=2682100 RepID=A0A6L6WG87_9RHOB|nr:ABC transporter substrate-binding protein [Zongyanglinia huanghaiensis]MVO14692.1 ABC transporter substrate-binding protein [Zongyanglinia huanghaiensis]
MSVFSRLYTTSSLLIVATMASHMALAQPASRIVTVGGSVTEIVYALDQQDRIIARDTTSSYPDQVAKLPDIGYARALSPEGVLSVAPDLIIAIEGAGPPETIDVLQSAQVGFVSVPEVFTADGIVAKIRTVGAAVDQVQAAEVLVTQVASELTEAQNAAQKAANGDPKKVLFILSTQGGRIMAGGTNTAADGIIHMAGGINAVTAFDGYKPLTDEAVTIAAPDVILMMDRGGDHGAAAKELLAMPALIPTPAAQNGKVVRMNGLHLLGFGPRTASAITELSQALYGETN